MLSAAARLPKPRFADSSTMPLSPSLPSPSRRSNSLDDPLKRGQRQVESTKMLAGMQIDDSHFRNRLLATQVLSTKDHTAWNVEIVIELLEGPLLNPKRLDEAMRASKFMRRLLGFFHPFAYRYSEVKRTKVRPLLSCALSEASLSPC